MTGQEGGVYRVLIGKPGRFTLNVVEENCNVWQRGFGKNAIEEFVEKDLVNAVLARGLDRANRFNGFSRFDDEIVLVAHLELFLAVHSYRHFNRASDTIDVQLADYEPHKSFKQIPIYFPRCVGFTRWQRVQSSSDALLDRVDALVEQGSTDDIIARNVFRRSKGGYELSGNLCGILCGDKQSSVNGSGDVEMTLLRILKKAIVRFVLGDYGRLEARRSELKISKAECDVVRYRCEKTLISDSVD
jgi:hypothetical protein